MRKVTYLAASVLLAGTVHATHIPAAPAPTMQTVESRLVDMWYYGDLTPDFAASNRDRDSMNTVAKKYTGHGCVSSVEVYQINTQGMNFMQRFMETLKHYGARNIRKMSQVETSDLISVSYMYYVPGEYSGWVYSHLHVHKKQPVGEPIHSGHLKNCIVDE